MRVLFALPLLALCLTACDNDAKRFPGFNTVDVPGQDVIYLYELSPADKQNIAYQEGRFSAFTLLKKLDEGYVIQAATTDCLERIITKDGYFYSYRNETRKEYPGSIKPFEVGNDPHLRMLLKAVCIQKEPLATDAIVGAEVSIIPHKQELMGFLTKESTARSHFDDSASATVTINNGTEVIVKGESSDGKWAEIEHKGYKKLYVPAENVATFSD